MLRPWLSSKLFSLRSREWRSSDRSEGFKFFTAKRGSDTGYLSDVVPAAGLVPPGPLVPHHLLPGAVILQRDTPVNAMIAVIHEISVAM